MGYKYGFGLFGYEEDIDSLLETCNSYNISLSQCAEICKLMAPLCDEKSPQGVINWLKRMLQVRENVLGLTKIVY